VVGLVALLSLVACGPQSSARPGGLTARGDLLFDLEGLLGQQFGSSLVSVTGRADFSCSGVCTPLSTYSPYFYVFAHHTATTLHLSRRQPATGTDFGNYPVPVLIRGKFIACNSDETQYLVMLADTPNFALQCVTPLLR